MLELGPILRALHRNRSSAFLLVLETAFGFLIIASLFAASRWYIETGSSDLGHPHGDLIVVRSAGPALDEDHAAAFAAGQTEAAAEREAILTVPGVEAAVAVSRSPFEPQWLVPAGLWATSSAAASRVALQTVGYTLTGDAQLADVLGLRFIAGGSLSRLTPDRVAQSVVISRSTASKVFGRTDVVGESMEGAGLAPFTVAGVFADATLVNPFATQARSLVLRAGPAADERTRAFIVKATPGTRDQVLPRLQATVAARRPDRVLVVVPYDVSSARYHQTSSGIVTVLALMGGMLGLVALLGALAVSSFLVASRTRQIGIRRALGASRGAIVRYFMLENAVMTTGGLVLGLAMTAVFFALVGSVFPGLHLRPPDLAATAALLLIDCVLAALVPALRAARIEPSVATRTV